jgi:hypothetical protein
MQSGGVGILVLNFGAFLLKRKKCTLLFSQSHSEDPNFQHTTIRIKTKTKASIIISRRNFDSFSLGIVFGSSVTSGGCKSAFLWGAELKIRPLTSETQCAEATICEVETVFTVPRNTFALPANCSVMPGKTAMALCKGIVVSLARALADLITFSGRLLDVENCGIFALVAGLIFIALLKEEVLGIIYKPRLILPVAWCCHYIFQCAILISHLPEALAPKWAFFAGE